MTKLYATILLAAFSTIYVSAQNLILNPGFEDHNLSNGCYVNQPDSIINQNLNNVWAFYADTINGLEIGVNDNCFSGGANSGSTHIVMAGLSGPNMFESISFKLSSEVMMGNTYDLTFFAANSSPVDAESLAVGISTDSTSFGTQATLVPLGSSGTYTQYSVNFTAPINGAYLTIQPAELDNFWFGLDDFSLELNTVLDLEKNQSASSITLYPNPSSQNTISLEGIEGIQSYSILNGYGQEVLKGTLYDARKIEINTLSQGLYFIKIDNHLVKFTKE